MKQMILKIISFIKGISSFFANKKKGDDSINLSLVMQNSNIITNGNITFVIIKNNKKN
jgi:hypothetical protein